MQTEADIRQWIAGKRDGVLATVENPFPFTSLAAFLYEEKKTASFGCLYFFFSDLARHTRNIKKNPNVSFLIQNNAGKSGIYERERLTLTGNLRQIETRERVSFLKEQYLKTFPESSVFLNLPDFRFYELVPEEAYWVGGFGKIRSFKSGGA